MATDKELIKEAGQELWNTVKKLRPGLPKEARSQLVLKALLTIGDLPDQLQASMVLGQIADQEPDEAPGERSSQKLTSNKQRKSADQNQPQSGWN